MKTMLIGFVVLVGLLTAGVAHEKGSKAADRAVRSEFYVGPTLVITRHGVFLEGRNVETVRAAVARVFDANRGILEQVYAAADPAMDDLRGVKEARPDQHEDPGNWLWSFLPRAAR